MALFAGVLYGIAYLNPKGTELVWQRTISMLKGGSGAVDLIPEQGADVPVKMQGIEVTDVPMPSAADVVQEQLRQRDAILAGLQDESVAPTSAESPASAPVDATPTPASPTPVVEAASSPASAVPAASSLSEAMPRKRPDVPSPNLRQLTGNDRAGSVQ